MADDAIKGTVNVFVTGELPFDYKDVKQSVHQTKKHVSERMKDLKQTTLSDFNNYISSPKGLQESVEIGFAIYTMSKPILKTPTSSVAAKGGGNVVEQVAVHGNSLKSLKPTWGYKLYSTDGTFLKNGITSKLVPERRYTKAFMLDKKMVPFKQFPNRLEAWQWEFQQNQILRGPLNKNMH